MLFKECIYYLGAFIYNTVESLLLVEPTFGDQNTNLCLAALNISDVSIENIARLKYLVISIAQAQKLTTCSIKV